MSYAEMVYNKRSLSLSFSWAPICMGKVEFEAIVNKGKS